jgi:hypothetical protein
LYPIFHAFIFRAGNYNGPTIYFGSRNTHGRSKGTVNLLFGADRVEMALLDSDIFVILFRLGEANMLYD